MSKVWGCQNYEDEFAIEVHDYESVEVDGMLDDETELTYKVTSLSADYVCSKCEEVIATGEDEMIAILKNRPRRNRF